MMDADAAVPARLLEQTRASIDESLALAQRWHGARERPAARGVRAAVRGVVLARAARSGRRAVGASTARSCTRTPRSQRDEIAIVEQRTGRPQHRVPRRHRPGVAAPVRRALRVGGRARAGAARRARRQGAALPRLEPEARIGHRAGRRDARARHLRVARRRRRGLQQPPRHVRGDAAGRHAAGGAARARRAAGARRGLDGHARRRADARASRPRSARSSPASAPTSSSSTAIGRTSRPDRDPYSTLVYAARGTDVRTTIVDGEVLVRRLSARCASTRPRSPPRPARGRGASWPRARGDFVTSGSRHAGPGDCRITSVSSLRSIDC